MEVFFENKKAFKINTFQKYKSYSEDQSEAAFPDDIEFCFNNGLLPPPKTIRSEQFKLFDDVSNHSKTTSNCSFHFSEIVTPQRAPREYVNNSEPNAEIQVVPEIEENEEALKKCSQTSKNDTKDIYYGGDSPDIIPPSPHCKKSEILKCLDRFNLKTCIWNKQPENLDQTAMFDDLTRSKMPDVESKSLYKSSKLFSSHSSKRCHNTKHNCLEPLVATFKHTKGELSGTFHTVSEDLQNLSQPILNKKSSGVFLKDYSKGKSKYIRKSINNCCIFPLAKKPSHCKMSKLDNAHDSENYIEQLFTDWSDALEE